MGKKLYFIIIALVCLIVTYNAKAEIDTNIIEHARDATVLISGNQGGMGSGIILNEDGLVLTNYHVIHRAEELRVWFYDLHNNNFYSAEIVGIDPIADLALIQMKVPDYLLPLKFLTMETETWEVGEEVFAIGHPMGIQWTVSLGHLANLERTGRITPYVNTIQHSAEIHQGNSGGPLINRHGRVVGVNTYLLLPNKQWSGIAYAIKSDIVKWSINQMLESGMTKYPAFKLDLRGLNPFGYEALKELDPDNKIPKDLFGLVVFSLTDESYAKSQGMRRWDIVVAIDGHPVNNLLDVREILMPNYKPGQVVDLIYVRDGHFRRTDYILSEIEFDYLDYYDDSANERQLPEQKEEDEDIEVEPEDDEPSAFEEKEEN